MRLVHSDHGYAEAATYFEKGGRTKPLGSNINYLVLAVFRVLQHFQILRMSKRAVDICRGDARLDECADLILHQRDERRDDYGNALEHQRRYLIAYRFSRARRHYAQNIAPAEQAVGYPVLSLAKGIVTEIFF